MNNKMITIQEISDEVYHNQEKYTGLYIGEWGEYLVHAAMKMYVQEVIDELMYNQFEWLSCSGGNEDSMGYGSTDINKEWIRQFKENLI